MLGVVVATLVLSIALAAALRGQGRCGAYSAMVCRTCYGLSLRQHMSNEEHVWTDDEVLYRMETARG